MISSPCTVLCNHISAISEFDREAIAARFSNSHQVGLVVKADQPLKILGCPHSHSSYGAHSCGSSLHSIGRYMDEFGDMN